MQTVREAVTKAVDKARVAAAAGLIPEPFAQAGKPSFQAEQLPQDGAQRQAQGDEHGLSTGEGAAAHLEHPGHGAGDADKQHGDAAGLLQRLLPLRVPTPPGEQAEKPAQQNTGAIDDCSQAQHDEKPRRKVYFAVATISIAENGEKIHADGEKNRQKNLCLHFLGPRCKITIRE